MRMRVAVALGAVLLGRGAASAEESWLPPSGADAVAAMLAERMKTIGLGGQASEEELRGVSRQSVDALAARLASWGEKSVLEHAPALPQLALPQARQPHLDATARYLMCAGAYEVLHMRGAFAKSDRGEQIKAAMAGPSLSVTLLYVRHRYLQVGGTDAKMEAFGTDPRMEAPVARIQDDTTVLDSVYKECRTVVNWLVDQ